MKRRAVALFFVAALSGCRGCERASTRATDAASDAGPNVLAIPRAASPLVGDGDLDEPAWQAPARTGTFLDENGRPSRPYSDARLLWDDDHLYLALYAADEDQRKPKGGHDAPIWLGDAFVVRITAPGGPTHQIAFGVDGTVSDGVSVDGGAPDPGWESGAHAAVERDGTLDHPEDDDEEWLVEAAIPWQRLGVAPKPGTTFAIAFERCDVPKRSARTCAGWSGSARLDAK